MFQTANPPIDVSRLREVELAEELSRSYLVLHLVCPIGTLDDVLYVAVAPESQESSLGDLSIAYRMRVEPVIESRGEVEARIARLVGDSESGFEGPVDEFEDEFTADIEDLANQPPVVRYVNLLVRDAHEAGASDIHLEQARRHLHARVRIDGRLIDAVSPAEGLGQAVISRIKLLAEMDISERRRPQDGRIRVVSAGGDIDLRVSTVPTLHGESVVMRLLERGTGPIELSDLGMSNDLLTEFRAAVQRPRGMVLVTGPTGSGKTTTLYGALRLRDRESEKIITVEDPVEYELNGVAQVPVRQSTGLTFAAALRSLLRQDPDVMLIGEMRDQETAEIAVQSALTGHFVFSTLHTNDAVGAIPRMIDLGVPPYLIAATVDGVLAQRLVRRVCVNCASEDEPSAGLMSAFASALSRSHPAGMSVRRLKGAFVRGAGCDGCRGTGFKGRTGIFEWLPMSTSLRDLVARGATEGDLRRAATAQGFQPLLVDAWSRVAEGRTTIEEVLSVANL